MSPPLVTLREYRPADVEHFVRLFTDAEVSAFVGGPLANDRAVTLFESLLGSTHERAVAAFAVVSSDLMVGHAVLFANPEPTTLELGYMIERRSWGRGLGTATAALLLAKIAELGKSIGLGTVDTTNAASIRILAKLGGVLEMGRDDEGEFYTYRIAVSPQKPS